MKTTLQKTISPPNSSILEAVDHFSAAVARASSDTFGGIHSFETLQPEHLEGKPQDELNDHQS